MDIAGTTDRFSFVVVIVAAEEEERGGVSMRALRSIESVPNDKSMPNCFVVDAGGSDGVASMSSWLYRLVGMGEKDGLAIAVALALVVRFEFCGTYPEEEENGFRG